MEDVPELLLVEGADGYSLGDPVGLLD